MFDYLCQVYFIVLQYYAKYFQHAVVYNNIHLVTIITNY